MSSFKGTINLKVTYTLPVVTYEQILAGESTEIEETNPQLEQGRRKTLRKSKGGKARSSDFNWGYGGSGPYCLAHSILTVMYGEKLANEHAMNFKFQVIGRLTNSLPFELSYKQVRGWMELQGVSHQPVK